MQLREIELIYDELKDVEKIISNTSKLLKKYPNDIALQNDLLNFNIRKKELSIELNKAKRNLVLTDANSFNQNRDIFGNIFEKISQSVDRDLGKQYIIALLHSNDNKPIKTKIKLMKELFLISDRVPSLMNDLEFEADSYGPSSDVALGYIDEMTQIGLINVKGSKTNKIYSLGEFGKRYILENGLSLNMNLINEIKAFCDDLTNDELLALTYFSFPEMTCESLIKPKIMKNRIKLSVSLYKKGKINLQKACEISGLDKNLFLEGLNGKS